MPYDGEICQDCGFPVAHYTGPTYWHAPDGLWQSVIGSDAGVLCPPCFVLRAEKLGLNVVLWAYAEPFAPPELGQAARRGKLPTQT